MHDDPSIPTLDSLTITVEAINSPQDNTIISGVVNSNPRVTNFVNSRGEASKSLQLQLSNEAGNRSLRTVIWNVDESRVPKVFKTGSKVRLIGVRAKQGNPQYGER